MWLNAFPGEGKKDLINCIAGKDILVRRHIDKVFPPFLTNIFQYFYNVG